MKNRGYIILTVIGFALAAAGLWSLKSGTALGGGGYVLPYLCIGAGCGAFGHGMGELIGRRALKHAQDVRRQIEIEQKDERNIAIMNRAKGKAYDAMIYIFGALMVSFALMELEMAVVLLLVFAYLLVVGISIYYRCKYNREM